MRQNNFISIFTHVEIAGKSNQELYHINFIPELFKIIKINNNTNNLNLYDFVVKTIAHYPFLLFPVHKNSASSYKDSFSILSDKYQSGEFTTISAVYLPHIEIPEIVDEALCLCEQIKSLLLINESDFYDYMMS